MLLTSIDFPNATHIGLDFLKENTNLTYMNLPKIDAEDIECKRLRLVVAKNKMKNRLKNSVLNNIFVRFIKNGKNSGQK